MYQNELSTPTVLVERLRDGISPIPVEVKGAAGPWGPSSPGGPGGPSRPAHPQCPQCPLGPLNHSYGSS